MKSTITNIFLGTFILISGHSMSQDNVFQKQPFNVESSVSESLLTPTIQEIFKVRIGPNPTLNGKVSMQWPVGNAVTEIRMILAGTFQIKVIEVEEGQHHVSVSNLQEGKYFIRFIGNKKVLGTRKLKVIG